MGCRSTHRSTSLISMTTEMLRQQISRKGEKTGISQKSQVLNTHTVDLCSPLMIMELNEETERRCSGVLVQTNMDLLCSVFVCVILSKPKNITCDLHHHIKV